MFSSKMDTSSIEHATKLLQFLKKKKSNHAMLLCENSVIKIYHKKYFSINLKAVLPLSQNKRSHKFPCPILIVRLI